MPLAAPLCFANCASFYLAVVLTSLTDKLKREARNITWTAGDSWNAFMRKPAKPKRVPDEENIAEVNDEADHAASPPISDLAEPGPLTPSGAYEMDGVDPAAAHVVRRRGDKSDETAQDPVPDEDESTMGAEKSLYRRLFLDNPVPVGVQVRAVLFPHWYTINWLLVAVPTGIALHFVKGMSPLAIFVVNFLAIIPLAGILSFATEEIALRVGEVIGGLLNASFGFVLLPSRPAANSAKKCCRADCCHNRAGQEGDFNRANLSSWEHALQSAAGHGHVLFLRRMEPYGAVLQHHRGPDCRQSPGPRSCQPRHTNRLHLGKSNLQSCTLEQ